MKKYFYLTIVFLIALVIRLYPTLITGMPFSIDAWSPIRNSEVIVKYTPINLESNLLDGYNSYWPANSFYGIILSYLTGVDSMEAMSIGIPLAGSLTIVIFYALVYRVLSSHEVALIASLILATVYPYSFFTAGVTKETYANPLYILLISLFLFRKGYWRTILLFTLVAVALVTAHHLSTIVTMLVLTSIILARIVIRVKKGIETDTYDFIFFSILLVAAVLYYMLFAIRGFKYTIGFSDVISVISYEVVFFTAAVYIVLTYKYTSLRGFIESSITVIILTALALISTRISIVVGAPVLPVYYIIYMAPFIVLSPIVVLGIRKIIVKLEENKMTLIFWLTVLLGLEAYAVFSGSPLGLTLAYRIINFICIPFSILAGYALHEIYVELKNTRIYRVLLVFVIVVSTIAISIYTLHASIHLHEEYLGYFWQYNIQEYRAAEWLSKVSSDVIAGDVKSTGILRDYFRLKVDVLQGLQYLTKGDPKPRVLYVYSLMYDNGYVLHSGYSVDLPAEWPRRVEVLNKIYTNKFVEVYNG